MWDDAVLPSWASFCVFIAFIFLANREDTISEGSESQLQSLVLPFIPKVKAGREGQLLSLHAEALLYYKFQPEMGYYIIGLPTKSWWLKFCTISCSYR